MLVHLVPDIPSVDVIHYRVANDSQGDVLRVLMNQVVS